MAGTVGQNQVGAFTSPSPGDPEDATVVKANDNANRTAHNAHDADATIHVQSSALASRPAAATVSRLWVTSDGLRFYYDTGSAWNELAYLPLVGGALTGNVSIVQATAADASVSLGYSGAARAYVAAIATAGDIINGSAIGDLAIRNASGSIRISADGGTSSILTLTSTGVALAGALTHIGSTAGFFNKTAVARPSITTSKTGADALALALLNALGDVVGVGLVHDATT